MFIHYLTNLKPQWKMGIVTNVTNAQIKLPLLNRYDFLICTT
jgi:hypothetical protein